MKKHLIFMAAFASLALLGLTAAVGLIDHGRSMQFVLVWMISLLFTPLYILSSWLTIQVEKEGY